VTILAACSCGLLTSCGGGGGSSSSPPPPTTYVLTVSSVTPASGVSITVTPADNSGASNGSTSFTRTYNAATRVTLTAAATSGGNKFSSWTGCTTATTVTCNITMNAATTVTATYAARAITKVDVTPNPASAVIGATQQFTAAVTGPAVTDSTVTWTITPPSGSTLSAGTIDKTGLYTTPFPAPATVTVTATSNQDNTVAGSATVTLSAPAAASGPALTVDVATQTHAINPYIYGMNAYQLTTTTGKAANIGIDRWGGDATSRYNYTLDVTSSASDYFFENQNGLAGGSQSNSSFNAQVTADQSVGARTIGTLPVNGWVAKDGTSCSFPVATYPGQQSADNSRGCGNGIYPMGTQGCTNVAGCNVTGNDPTLTSTNINVGTWEGNWVGFLVGKFGPAASGGVAVYDLDNEPTWWDGVHRDVHPVAFTYDEVTNNGIAVAKAVKSADSTAEVSGPVMDFWWAYFYSKKDIESGWGSGPCYQPWQNPVDRSAHGGVPFIEYYLQQFAAAEKSGGQRLLDYVDLHTYFAADNLAFSTAGDTGTQQARLNSTRVFWDPTYTDPNFNQPNYITDANYTASCTVPLQAPQVIPMMKGWVAKDYPGTKLAITEYNWGGQEHINGALAQADILGIFGRDGLDIGTLWGPPDPATQAPGLMAFEAFRNYDGKNAMFGDMAVSTTSADQGKLSVYGALRTKDNIVTLVVINKTYGDLASTVSVDNLPATTTAAQAFLYSNANLAAITAQPNVIVTPPSGTRTLSTINSTFPAQSITILVMPN
jgi:Glycoside hydrolase family 44/Bacterial Ig-like domain (group 2)